VLRVKTLLCQKIEVDGRNRRNTPGHWEGRSVKRRLSIGREIERVFNLWGGRAGDFQEMGKKEMERKDDFDEGVRVKWAR
jgi:hypothetical protein